MTKPVDLLNVCAELPESPRVDQKKRWRDPQFVAIPVDVLTQSSSGMGVDAADLS